MKKYKKLIIALFVMLFVSFLAMCTYYFINISRVSKDDTLKTVTIEEGSIESIGITLKENNLIKNVTIFKVYAFLNNQKNLKAGVYELSENMGVSKIVDILESGSSYGAGEISITFKEGINIRKIASLIEENTNNSYDDVLTLVNDDSYIDSLIDKYWFLSDEIKNNDIYYSLEGYLYPNTYRFSNKDVKIEDIFSKMLDEMDKKLSTYKDDIDKNDMSVHEFITLASIVELEGTKTDDRKKVAGVFYNRLNSPYYATLGSDATTYYASKIDDWTQSLTSSQLDDCSNKYNTRCVNNSDLPVGPICNPSIESIEASINPENHDYYYFVADCDGKVYMTKNDTEHINIINRLKNEGNWCA